MMTSEMQSKLVVLKIESFLKETIEKTLSENIIDNDIYDMMKILNVNEEYLKQFYIKNIKISNMEKIKSLNDMNNVSYEFIFGLKEKRLNLTESDINLLMIIQRILVKIVLIEINIPIKNFTYSNINKNPINSKKLKETWKIIKNNL